MSTVCPVCRKPLDSEYVTNNLNGRDEVYFHYVCPEHGEYFLLASEYPDDFARWISYPSVCVPPKQAITKAEGCPLSCGTCDEHLMSACCVLLEVTQNCNLSCPWCYAAAGLGEPEKPDLDLQTVSAWYDRLISLGESRPFNIQLSGGEPTIRDDLPEIVRMGRDKGFTYLQLNTNGLRIADDLDYTLRLKDAGLSTVFLQFDGFKGSTYEILRGWDSRLRGNDMKETKLRCIENCGKAGLPVTLVPTVLPGVNDDEIGAMIELMLSNLSVIKGIHMQPAAHFGRVGKGGRITMFEVMHQIEKQTSGRIKAADMVPITTGHPLCCFCGTFIKEADGSITPLVNDEEKNEGSSCCCEPSADEILRKDRDFVLNRWQRPDSTSPDCHTSLAMTNSCHCEEQSDVAIPQTDGELLDFDEAAAFLRSRMFTVSGMGFMDGENLDTERLSRCRVQIFTPDERLIPFCSYNSLYRKV